MLIGFCHRQHELIHLMLLWSDLFAQNPFPRLNGSRFAWAGNGDFGLKTHLRGSFLSLSMLPNSHLIPRSAMLATDRPNFLLLVTDQQRFDTIAAAGAGHMFTPHLNWLLESGIQFCRGYTDSPVCVAARASLLTGCHHHRMVQNGWWGQQSAADATDTLPAHLTRAGYQTHGYGKFHYHPDHANFGWEHRENLGIYYRGIRRQGDRVVPMEHGVGQNEMEPVLSTVHENDSLTHWITRRGIDFLETRDETRPFCLYLGYSNPHPPFDPPPNYWALYANREVPSAVYGDWSKEVEEIPGGFMEATWGLNGVDRFTPEQLAQCRRAYYALITQIDYSLGLLFGRLRELGLLENTWIFFTSDHGEMLGDHHMGAKSVFLEPSAHVPFLVRPPASHAELRGTSSEALVCLADIFPTINELAGATMPEKVDGLSLVDLATGKAERERLFGRCGNQYGLIEKELMYTWTSAGGDELLFDLSTDPEQRVELIRAGQHGSEHERMRRLLAEEMECHGDAVAKNGELQAATPAPTRREKRIAAWPGWHTKLVGDPDVLH